MKLTNRILQRIISEEKKSLEVENTLRKSVRRQVKMMLEDKPKTGAEGSDAEGKVDVKKIADVLGIDASKLKTAVTNIQNGKRNSADNAIFGDMIAKLIDASPEDTVKTMNVLKKVSADEGKDK